MVDVMDQTRMFYDIVSRIELSDKPLREIYDESQRHTNGYAEVPIEMRERNIKRCMVNSIRHVNSFDYSADLKQLNKINRKHKETNYHQYKNIILHKIAEKYPFLAEECNKSKVTVQMVKRVS